MPGNEIPHLWYSHTFCTWSVLACNTWRPLMFAIKLFFHCCPDLLISVTLIYVCRQSVAVREAITRKKVTKLRTFPYGGGHRFMKLFQKFRFFLWMLPLVIQWKKFFREKKLSSEKNYLVRKNCLERKSCLMVILNSEKIPLEAPRDTPWYSQF